MYTTIIAHYRGIDAWNRPVFRAEGGAYYCLVDTLFSHRETPTQAEIDEAVAQEGAPMLKGVRFEGEPICRVQGVRLLM